jgi:hypothetical protein
LVPLKYKVCKSTTIDFVDTSDEGCRHSLKERAEVDSRKRKKEDKKESEEMILSRGSQDLKTKKDGTQGFPVAEKEDKEEHRRGSLSLSPSQDLRCFNDDDNNTTTSE